MESLDQKSFAYKAFISYAQAGIDQQVAVWLQTAIEEYKVPPTLVQLKKRPARVGKVFRDATDTRFESSLSELLEDKLDASEFLIVLCSPRSDRPWVNAEVRYFLDQRGPANLIPVLIEGEPPGTFPEPLRELSRCRQQESGEPGLSGVKDAPLAPDLRERPGIRISEIRRDALLKIVAALIDCDFDDLRQRDKERAAQQRRNRVVGGVILVLILACLLGWGLYQYRGRLLAIAAGQLQANQIQHKADQRQLALANWQAGLRARDFEDHAIAAAHKMLRAADIFDELGDGANASQSLFAAAFMPTCRTFVHHSEVEEVAVSPSPNRVLTLCSDGIARLWDRKQGELIFEFRHESTSSSPYDDTFRRPPQPVVSAAYSSDGSRLLTHSHYGSLRVWDLSADPPRQFAAHDVVLTLDYAKFNRQGTRVLMTSQHGREKPKPRVWNVGSTGSQEFTEFPEGASASGIEFATDGTHALTWTDESAVIWDVSTSKATMIGQPLPHEQLAGVALDRGGERLLTWSRDGTAKLWSVRAAIRIAEFKHADHDTERDLTRAAFSPDEKRILTRSRAGVLIWDVNLPDKLRAVLRHHSEESLTGNTSGILTKGVFLADGRVLTWGGDDTVRVWSLWDDEPAFVSELIRPDPRLAASLGNQNTDFQATPSPDGRFVATWSNGSAADIWSLETGRRLGVCRHEGVINGVVFCGDGADVITWSSDGTARIWRFTNSSGTSPPWKAVTIQPANTADKQLVSNPDGFRILVRNGAQAAFWNVRQPEELNPLTADSTDWLGTLLSRDGRRLLFWSKNRPAAQVIDAATGDVQHEIPHGSGIRGAASSEDERWLVLWSDADSTFSVWDRGDSGHGEPREVGRGRHDDPRLPHALGRVGEPIETASISPDGKFLLTYRKRYAVLWKVQELAVKDAKPRLLGSPEQPPLLASDWSWAVALGGGNVALCTLPDCKETQEFSLGQRRPLGLARKVARSDDNARIAVVTTMPNLIQIWDHPARRFVAEFKYDGTANGLRFNRDGSLILICSSDGIVQIGDISGRRPPETFEHSDAVLGAFWTKDERRLVTWTSDTIRLWSVADRQLIRSLEADTFQGGVQLTEDESRLLAWDSQGKLVAFDTGVNESVPIGPLVEQKIRQLEFDTGTRLGESGTLRVLTVQEWDNVKKEICDTTAETTGRPARQSPDVPGRTNEPASQETFGGK